MLLILNLFPYLCIVIKLLVDYGTTEDLANWHTEF